jgi:hypothetical protein
MSRDRVLFDKKAQKIGEVWALIATHPSGQQEDVIGFHTEKEAKEWRKSNVVCTPFDRTGSWLR